ncbi:MAG: glycosyltransferase, partial [Gemmatimonadales bacterium]|nr:glycosyltransferase [Gemmatimonadales bacterium]
MTTLVEFLPALPWLAPFIGLRRLANNRPNLSDVPPVTGPYVSIIVPARNEAGTIETIVRSILASTYDPFDLTVVDDRSDDDTAAIVAALATADPRLRLIRGDALPPGWYGKPWACFQGYRAAAGELLLFTDADTRHDPALLAHAVGALRAEGADLVTVSPFQRCVGFWERVVMPQIWLLLGLRYHPRRVNRARRERDVIANGQFILVRREAYEAVGTHEAVRHEVAEDLALAQAFYRNCRKLHFVFAERLMETRMYQSLPEMIEGWSKNVYLGGRRSFPNEPALRALVPAMLGAALLFWLVPPIALAAGGFDGLWGPAATLATALAALFWMLIGYGMRIPLGYGLLYPLGAVMALYIVARSTLRGGRRVEWRGRVYGEGDG